MSERAITTEVRDHVLLVGLDRPAKRNAFTVAMLDQLARAYARLEDDPDLRCLLLFAHGEHFTGGLDLADVVAHRATTDEPLFASGVDPLGLAGRTRTKPVVMAARGLCLTIGVELALASDVVIAGDDLRFAMLEVRRGILAIGGATLRLPRVAGWQDAMRVLLTGDFFDARDAVRMRIVQKVVPAGQELDEAFAVARSIARQAPLAVQATLASARMGLEEGFRAGADALDSASARLATTEDAAEGLRSFVERREARFVGR